MRRGALALLALVLIGCETTQEKSARLKREAKHVALASAGLSIARASTQVQVVRAVVVSSAEGAAVAVTVRNRSSRTLAGVPLAVTVTEPGGRVVYQNNAPGLEAALTSVPSLAPHQTLTWVDDQLPASVGAAHASARLGEAASASATVTALPVTGVTPIEGPTGGSGAGATVSDRSAVARRDVVVFGVALRGSRVVAAGRAVVPEVPAGGSAPIQLYFIGDPRGARLELVATPVAR